MKLSSWSQLISFATKARRHEEKPVKKTFVTSWQNEQRILSRYLSSYFDNVSIVEVQDAPNNHTFNNKEKCYAIDNFGCPENTCYL